MRILEFNVRKQRLIKKQDCSFGGLVAGSVGYLYTEFHFLDSEWVNCPNKIARFWIGDSEHALRLDDSNRCLIPQEVLTGDKFEVSVLGVAPGYKIETNRISVRQEVH